MKSLTTPPPLLPDQPPLLFSYWESGKLLHLSVVLFVLESYAYMEALKWVAAQQYVFWTAVFFACFLFSFAHIFLVLADGWSRFQDYKRAKDQLFEYGFKKRILFNYSTSQCQRSAVVVAAKELGFGAEAQKYYAELGYRWYHLLPDFMMRDPFFFYKRYFWRRTFLEKNYRPKYNYHQIRMRSQIA
jgi:hypothetical protein